MSSIEQLIGTSRSLMEHEVIFRQNKPGLYHAQATVVLRCKSSALYGVISNC